MNSPAAAAKVVAADQPSKLLRLSRRPGAYRCAEKSWGDSIRLVPSRCLPGMSSKTASGAQGERRVTVPLHDSLDSFRLQAGLGGQAPSASAAVSPAGEGRGDQGSGLPRLTGECLGWRRTGRQQVVSSQVSGNVQEHECAGLSPGESPRLGSTREELGSNQPPWDG